MPTIVEYAIARYEEYYVQQLESMHTCAICLMFKDLREKFVDVMA